MVVSGLMETRLNGFGAACKFFVTDVKNLSTGVKYMDSKVDFWFYSYWEGGGKMCRSTMRRGGGGAKCVEVLCVEILQIDKKILMTFYLSISKTV